MKKQVFLGGSCNPTTWRQDVAIPFLESVGVEYYNPQVDDWHKGLVKLEAEAKADSEALLFVIDNQTRAIASILEATEYVVSGRHVFLVIEDIEEGAVVAEQTVIGNELKDLNRARAYLRDVVSRHGEYAYVCTTVESATCLASCLLKRI